MNLPVLSKEDKDKLLFLERFICRTHELFRDRLSGGCMTTPDRKEYGKAYVAIPTDDRIVSELFQLKKYFAKKDEHCPTFADIGAGLGNVVAIATALGFDAYAYELRAEYKTCLQHVTDYMNDRLIMGDAFKITKFPQDVIYLYQPIADSVLLEKLLHHVLDKSKKDVILVYHGQFPNTGTDSARSRLTSIQEYGRIYKKK